MACPPEIENLVTRFRENLADYRSNHYNETQVRREFIDPLFAALGWDVWNQAGHPEAYKDVVHEDEVRVGGRLKAPDYGFWVGGERKFFVEAKKPAIKIGQDPQSAYQLRRYAWSAGLPLSVLTNFAEFAVYDCRTRPNNGDHANVGRLSRYTFEEYVEKWDEIAALFARAGVVSGALDQFVQGTRIPRGTQRVDEAFLLDIETWRGRLARNIYQNNRTITAEELRQVTQATLDRIIFLRICEDRGIEPYGILQEAATGTGTYAQLIALFRRADARYNSGLFEPDTNSFEYQVRVSDEPLQAILNGLYYPLSPYEFSVIPADILGQIYEQFLGRTITIENGTVEIDLRPELRRAGGVFYTPTYVAKHIVEHTLSRALEGVSAESLSRAGKKTLRLVDPACGSGSFLIEAYQYLLNWYYDEYVSEDPERWTRTRPPRLYRDDRGGWKLTTAERKRILRAHVFGVDLDPQAVEVTKLSLLLKVLEGETKNTLQQSLRLYNEQALPDLDENIKQGNSLVETDVYDMVPQEERDEVGARLYPLDWESAFPDVMGEPRRGFDVVLGNPPYVYRNATDDLLRRYLEFKYTCTEGNYELYKFFIERALTRILRPNGRVGFIVSSSFLVLPTFESLRALILNSNRVERLAPLGPGVFRGATVDTTVVIIKQQTPPADAVVVLQAPVRPENLPREKSYTIRQSRFAGNPGHIIDYRLSDRGAALLERLWAHFPNIEAGFEFGVGINTGYIRDLLVSETRIDDRYHPMVPGSGIGRYGSVETAGWIMYDREFVRAQGDRGRSLPAEKFLSEPKILLVRTRNLSLPRRIIATIDADAKYNLNRLTNIIARPGHSLHGLLGILNSSLFNWIFSVRFFDYEVKPVYVRQCPMADTNDSELQTAVRRVLALHSARASARSVQERERMTRELTALERKIDSRVFSLYGLTREEADEIADFHASLTPDEDE